MGRREILMLEEKRLLEACKSKRAHIRPFIICFVDTVARSGKIKPLNFSDLDFENKLITYQTLNTNSFK
jgi:integrase